MSDKRWEVVPQGPRKQGPLSLIQPAGPGFFTGRSVCLRAAQNPSIFKSLLVSHFPLFCWSEQLTQPSPDSRSAEIDSTSRWEGLQAPCKGCAYRVERIGGGPDLQFTAPNQPILHSSHLTLLIVTWEVGIRTGLD